MDIVKILKKNDTIFFVLKNFQRFLKFIYIKMINLFGLQKKKVNSHIDEPNKFDWNTFSLNGQKYRKKILNFLFTKIKFETIIETGTEYGFTTKYLSQFTNRVISIEKSKTMGAIAKKNLVNEKNIQLILDDSKYLDKILNEKHTKVDKKKMTFFYLDAHSDDDYPILDEIDFILKNFENFVILIDDFEVPNDIYYGYDSFKGRKLNLRLIKNLLTDNLGIFFPCIPGIKETGRLRGYVLISNNIEAVDFMKNIQELSIFETNK